MQELNGSSGVVANMLTGLNVDEYFQRTEPAWCGPLSYLTDALGSTVALADSNGVIQDQYQYEPFGNTYPTTYNNTSTNPYQFTGRENDSFGFITMYFYRGRYYDPTLQRFISQDPIGFLGGDSNLYAYVGNNPIGSPDPRGMRPGDRFQTPTQAACDALHFINSRSIAQNIEYGGVIRVDPTTGEFYASEPVPGNQTSARVGVRIASDVGLYHNHGNYSIQDENGNIIATGEPELDEFDSDNFSRQDLIITSMV